MEELTNPDKLEVLWEQSKWKKLWDDSKNKPLTELGQYLSQSHPTEDSVSIEDYMIQTPNSPTPQENHRPAHLFSSEERDILEKIQQIHK